MAIQETIGVTEALNEQIRLAERERDQALARLSAASLRNTIFVASGVIGAATLGIIGIWMGEKIDSSVGMVAAFGAAVAVLVTGLTSQRPTAALRKEVGELNGARRQALLLAHAERIETEKAPLSEDTKECPRCAETIKARANVCRYCGHEFSPAAGQS